METDFNFISERSGKVDHIGQAAIQKWIESSNQQYQTTLRPISYQDRENGSVLNAEVVLLFFNTISSTT